MEIRMPRWLKRLLAPFAWNSRDRDMDQEMAFHLEAMVRDRVRAGMTGADAERDVRRTFGSVVRLKEQGHDLRTSRFAEDLLRDIRQAVRGTRRSPGFALAVILTLALGIGGNTAIFSVVDQVLLRPLPYPAGDQLLTIYEVAGSSGPPSAYGNSRAIADGPTRMSVSPANWLDWQRDSRTLQSIATWRSIVLTLTGAGEPLRLNAQLVSAEFFPLLGVEPLLGRTISEQDDRPNSAPVAVISYELWQRRFAGEPTVIGRVVQISDRPAEIIGVMPAGFRFIYPDTDGWGASRLDRSAPWRDTSGRFVNAVARLADGATLDAARAEMGALAQRLSATHAFNKNTGVELIPLREELTGEVRSSLIVLYAAVGVLLSIACCNVANLLLARASSRRREIAIRTSLGAGRAAIVRQLLVESLLLAAIGGALGIALARWSVGAVLAFAPPDLLRVPALSVDRRIFVYAFALSILTGLIVGLMPALLVARRSIVASLRTGGGSGSQSTRLRQAFVIGQVAMTVVLLCGAGLLVRTVRALNGTDSGFDREGLLTMEVALPSARYPPARRPAFVRDAVAGLRALPGVESAAAANSLPVVGSPRGGTVFHRLGTPDRAMNDRPSATIRVVTPGYFRTLGIPVLAGREFTEADDANPRPGFVVNEAFAAAYLTEVDPLTAVLTVWMQQENPYLPVIGVVGNVSEGSVRDNPQPTIYYSHRQMAEAVMTLFVRAQNPETLTRPAATALHAIDPGLAIGRMQTVETALGESLARERLSAMVAAAFALSGLLLAALGLYGLLAFLVAERTREIGIRMALGARVTRLIGSVVGGGLTLAAIGGAIGIAASALLLRPFDTLLFGVTPYDTLTYVMVVLLLGAVATLASYLPARRAARVQPLVALRQE
jgi:putative ABC transport system permease protein